MRGHVRKRGNKWCFVLDVGRDDSGRRVQRWFSGFRTKKDAERAMTVKLQEVECGIFVTATKETVEAYFVRWLADKQPQVRYHTHRKYEWLVTRHIVPGLGTIELAKLKPAHLQSLYTSMRNDSGLSPRSILHAHRIIHEALERAVKWGLVPRNVADAVEPPRADRYNAQVWTSEQASSFLKHTQAAEPRYWAVFVLALTTGMRKTEIMGLRWQDVDMELGYLSLQRTLDYIKGVATIKEMKTDRSRRRVAISGITLDALRHQRIVQAKDRLLCGPAYRQSDWVLTNEWGDPMSPNTVDNVWYRALKASGVRRIRFHDLRHTHASLLLQQGVNPKVVSERLGHATVQITLDTYSHVLPGLQRDAADRFDDLLNSPIRSLEN